MFILQSRTRNENLRKAREIHDYFDSREVRAHIAMMLASKERCKLSATCFFAAGNGLFNGYMGRFG